MALNNITLYILKSSIIFTINIIVVLVAKNTVLRHHQRYTRFLYVAAIIHAVYPYGILNIPVGQDAIHFFTKIVNGDMVVQMLSLTSFFAITLILYFIEYSAYCKEKDIFYVSHYDDIKNIYISCKNGPAFVSGVFKPRIVIPDNVEDEKYILSHEKQHILNRDNLIKLGYTILMKLFWFQPIVYLSKSQLDDVIEMCCDEKVTDSYEKADVVEYMYCMMRQVERQQEYSKKISFLNSFFAKRKSQLHKRVKYLKNIRKNNFMGDLMCRFAVVVLVFVMSSVGFGQGEPRQYVVEEELNSLDCSDIIYTNYICEDITISVRLDISDDEGKQSFYSKMGNAVFVLYEIKEK